MFDLENMLELNAKTYGIISVRFVVQQSVYENPVLVLIFSQNIKICTRTNECLLAAPDIFNCVYFAMVFRTVDDLKVIFHC